MKSGIVILSISGLVSQMIMMFFTVYLTSLYSPENFSMYVTYSSILTVLQGVVTGKYELALLSAKYKKVESGLRLISMCLSSFFLIIGVIVSIGLSLFLKLDFLYLILLTVSTFFFGINNTFLFSFNKFYSYNVIGFSRIVQSSIFGVLALTIGKAGYLDHGMLFSYTTALASVSLIYVIKFKNEVKYNFNTKVLYFLAIKYKSFPLFNASTSIFTGLSNQFPVLILSILSTASVVGTYGFVVKILSAPVGFISTAISQVNMRKVVELVHDKKDVFSYYLKCVFLLIVVGQIANLFILFFGEFLITNYLDKQWHSIMGIVNVLSTSILFKFSIVSVSGTLSVIGYNKPLAIWKTFYFLASMLVLTFAIYFYTFNVFIICIALLDIFFYTLLILITGYYLRNHRGSI